MTTAVGVIRKKKVMFILYSSEAKLNLLFLYVLTTALRYTFSMSELESYEYFRPGHVNDLVLC